MTKAELAEVLNKLADEALDCGSNKEAREISARANAFAKEHNCGDLKKQIFYRTGASDTLADMIINCDDSVIPTRPKF